MIDLHMHTLCSDGRCTPEELVQRAWDKGIRTMSVTDHDTMAGVEEALAAGSELGVEVVPGVEISVKGPSGSMHLLGYFRVARPEPVWTQIDDVPDHDSSPVLQWATCAHIVCGAVGCTVRRHGPRSVCNSG